MPVKTNTGLNNWFLAGLLNLLLLVAFISGTVPTMIFVAVAVIVMLKENDAWLKKSIVNSIFLIVISSAVTYLFSYVYDFMNIINFFLGFIDSFDQVYDGFGIMSFLSTLVDIAIKVYMLLVAIFSFSGKLLYVPGFKKSIEKNIQ